MAEVSAMSPLTAVEEPVEMESVGSLARLMLPELPGCSDAEIKSALVWALGEFCRATGACTVECRTVAVRGENVYFAPSAPCGMSVVSVSSVRVFHRELPERHCYSLVGENPVAVKIRRSMLCEGDRIAIVCSVAPKPGGEDCPARFMERYADGIVAGAMQMLLNMEGRPWANKQRAAQYALDWQNAKSVAALKRIAGSAGSNLGGLNAFGGEGGLF